MCSNHAHHLSLQPSRGYLSNLTSSGLPFQEFSDLLVHSYVSFPHISVGFTSANEGDCGTLKMRGVLAKHANSLLVFSLSLLLYLFLLLIVMRDFRVPDEGLYHSVGLAYVKGIASRNSSVFLENCEHPPLAKIITGMFVIVLKAFGVGEYPFPTRVHFSLAVALLAVLVFDIGEKLDGYRSGWFFWLFFLPVPAVASVRYYSVVDATSLLFLLLAFKYFLLERRYLRGGISYGLASLSKFLPLPLFPAVVISWSFYKKIRHEEILVRLKSICIGLLVFCLGEPLLWDPRLLSLMIQRLALQKHSLAIWSVPFLHFIEGERGAIFEVMSFVFYTVSYPCERFLSVNPYIVLVASLFFLAVNDKRLLDIEAFLLLWVSAAHLILAVHRVRMWYHDFWVMLPMSLFLASIVSRLIKKRPSSNLP